MLYDKYTQLSAMLTLCSLLAACQLETSVVRMAEVLRHENGLIVSRPIGYDAQRTEIGYTMTRSGEFRSPLTFRIEILANGKQPDVPPSWFGLFGFRYRIRHYDGGSGGSEYTLTAMHPLQQCWIVLTANQQAADSQPSFLEAWAVLDYASVGKTLKCLD
jgi:hypothetical protein